MWESVLRKRARVSEVGGGAVTGKKIVGHMLKYAVFDITYTSHYMFIRDAQLHLQKNSFEWEEWGPDL